MISPADLALAELRHLSRDCRANILIVGELSSAQRDEILQTLTLQRALNVFYAQRVNGFVLPSAGDVLLVLDNACSLSRHEQGRLLRWVSRHGAPIVSFASGSPYAMVCDGRFVDRLYYQLNTIYIAINSDLHQHPPQI
jgi:hypothetical protein